MNSAKKIVAGAAIVMVSMLGVALMPMAASADTAIIPTTGSGILSHSTSFGDLFVLDNLFRGSNNNGILSNGNGTSLGDLFILGQLFGGSHNSIVGGGIGNNNNLGSLFVLDNLFNGNRSNGLLGNNGTSLGDLFILNQLF